MNREQKSIAKLGTLLTGILLISWAGSFGFEWLADNVWWGFHVATFLWFLVFLVLLLWIGWELMRPDAELWPAFVAPIITGLAIWVAFIVVAANVETGIVVGTIAMVATFLNTAFVVGYLERERKS